MFVQVIKGRVSDPAQVRTHLESWASTVGQGADGWLGSTAGVTDDGTAVVLARFESEEAARRNSDRPEQGKWWTQMASYFDGEPEFQDCTVVDVDTYGDPDPAGFVQVMQGRVGDGLSSSPHTNTRRGVCARNGPRDAGLVSGRSRPMGIAVTSGPSASTVERGTIEAPSPRATSSRTLTSSSLSNTSCGAAPAARRARSMVSRSAEPRR
jgi:hypothetical protein